MNTTTLSNDIKSRYDQLTESAQTILKGCTIFCTEGVSIRHLYDVLGGEPHSFGKDVDTILRSGLLVETQNIVYAPLEVADVLSDITMPVDFLNSIISMLVDKTTLSTHDNLLHVQDFFTMGMAIMQYVVLNPDGIVYEEFGRLIFNLTRYYEEYAKPDPSIHDNSELQVMRAIRLAKEKINNKSLLYASLLTCEAYIELSGFWYATAKQFLDDAIAIEIKSEDNALELGLTYYVIALYYENYGQIARCLEYAYKAWEATGEEALKNYTAIYIAYQLAILDEFDACDDWVKRVDINSQPQFSVIRIYNHLIDALKYSNNETLAEKNIIQAEWSIDRINNLAPIKARIQYIKYIIECKWGLLREANVHYRDYATIHARHYATTDGAMYILAASEVHRLTSIGATTAAKFVINEKLDSLQLPNLSYALSVKMDACLSYCEYFRAINLPLYNTYYKMGHDFAEKTIPSKKTLTVLENVFKGPVPSAISGEETRWVWEYQNFQNMVTNRDRSRTELKIQIDHLKERFPSHQQELEVINTSLLDTHATISTLYKAITHAEQSEKFHVSLHCARIAVSLGLIWEGADFFNIVLNTEGYKNLCKYQQIDILIEVATNLENIGSRQEAKLIWVQLEALARGTSKLEDVWQARGNCSFNHEQYAEALDYYNKCIEAVQSEEGLIDQRLSSIYGFRTSCFGALGNYQAAYEDSVKAKQYFPMQDYSAFNLEYNHAFFAICLRKYKEARAVLTRAKTLARTEEEKDSVDELLSILAMKKADRVAYLKQILYNYDI